jgi:hypothetical protein
MMTMITMMTNIIIIDGEREEDFLVTYLTFKRLIWMQEKVTKKQYLGSDNSRKDFARIGRLNNFYSL